MKKLGEILVEKEWLSSHQVEEGLIVQKATGEFLGRIFVNRGWITEDQLLEALSEQFRIPRVRFEDLEIDWSLAGMFAPSLLTEHTCFPVSLDGSQITVAIANPLDAWAVSALEDQARLKGRRIKLVLATLEEIAGALRRHHQIALEKVRKSLEGGHDQ
ncbi:MAG: hypothetical protein NC910_03685 [Candidatus Omnitrophica bacterium]|nr:hypothetical protein [Candidatus Omnitrophota bacterium]